MHNVKVFLTFAAKIKIKKRHKFASKRKQIKICKRIW